MKNKPLFLLFGKIRISREAVADTLAMIVFSITTGMFSLIYEMYIAGLVLFQYAGLHLTQTVLRLITARLCGKLTDFIRKNFTKDSKNFLRKATADTISIVIYQIPLYVASALIMKATWKQIWFMSGMYFLDYLFTGFIYGIILDKVRKKLNIK